MAIYVGWSKPTLIMADTGEDRVQKMEIDYSSTVDEKIPKCEKLSKVFEHCYQ